MTSIQTLNLQLQQGNINMTGLVEHKLDKKNRLRFISRLGTGGMMIEYGGERYVCIMCADVCVLIYVEACVYMHMCQVYIIYICIYI